MGKKPIATGIRRGCGRLRQNGRIFGSSTWDEQRERIIAIQSELEKHLNSHNLICRRLTEAAGRGY